VEGLLSKLKSAKRRLGVVVAPPEAIKSLLLKFIEQVHSVEQLNLDQLTPNASMRNNREVVRMRSSMIARSGMADALVSVLDLWNEGVLIMDEVDVLLHPLRSELNFPIGHKDPIDLSGHRWNLPIHLIDAVLSCWDSIVDVPKCGEDDVAGKTIAVCEVPSQTHADVAGVPDLDDVLARLAMALKDGIQAHALQVCI
jgi:hypothetical protein